MAPSYNLASGHEAWYNVSPSGQTTVSVRSLEHLQPRAIYVGAASLLFRWVSTGKSTHWQFSPTLLDSTPAQASETSDGQSQIFNVELGNRMFPATGLLKTNMTGEIKAPAVHFDLPCATDLWVFLLRSPWQPLKIEVEKSTLKLERGSTRITAQLQDRTYDEDSGLRAYMSVHGEDLKNIQLSLKRNVQFAKTEEVIGQVVNGMELFTWKPLIRNFDVTLVSHSNIGLNQFIDFLKYLGANANHSFFASYMPNDFLLCDGPGIEYILKLSGEKRWVGHEDDETRLTLS